MDLAAGGVFAHHKAIVVGKARRPFIWFSEKNKAFVYCGAASGTGCFV